MAVYFRGMEKPVSCAGCIAFYPYITLDGQIGQLCKVADRDLDDPFGMGTPDWCPIIEVHELHGRLIDTGSRTFPTLHRNPSNDYMHGWNACLKSIHHQPTVIPASEEGEG